MLLLDKTGYQNEE